MTLFDNTNPSDDYITIPEGRLTITGTTLKVDISKYMSDNGQARLLIPYDYFLVTNDGVKDYSDDIYYDFI